jgi:hypothetical protein
MRIAPATGFFSGKIPGMRNGSSATVSYQGMLFADDLPIGTDGPVRGAGFATDSAASQRIVLSVP